MDSAAEAVRALCALFPEFRPWVLQQAERGVAWRVLSGRYCLTEDTLQLGGSGTLVFAPIIEGAGGGGGVWSIVAGVALIATAFIAAPVLGGYALSVGLLGGSLVLQGVASLLTPTPKLPNNTSKDPVELESNLFGRGTSSDAQGEVVPVLYGRRLVTNPRVIYLDLGLLPKNRDFSVSGTTDLQGFIDGRGL